MLVARGVQALGWAEPIVKAASWLGESVIAAVLGALFAGLAAALIWVRRRRAALVVRWIENPALAVSRWSVNYYVTAVLADSMAFAGLVGCLTLGRQWVLLAGGAAAYAGYALAFPRRRDLKPLEPAEPL